MAKVTHEFDLYGKHYVLETGELAKQATGACLVRQGDTTALVTVVVSKERKAELVKLYGKNENDSGSAAVQVAILTDRIRELTEHMKTHKKDFHTRRGLLMLVGKRRRLLSYIKKGDIEAYRTLIKSLGIRDNIQ